jgi:hypothetical protein
MNRESTIKDRNSTDNALQNPVRAWMQATCGCMKAKAELLLERFDQLGRRVLLKELRIRPSTTATGNALNLFSRSRICR